MEAFGPFESREGGVAVVVGLDGREVGVCVCLDFGWGVAGVLDRALGQGEDGGGVVAQIVGVGGHGGQHDRQGGAVA
ncbi:hypothetical protein [Streptomyces sp. NPDC059003]|uniref:hypothetical protein n=1 Tax=Streptomyces sp. NPDC059003 TaxID=3346691 RepID=UPI003694B6E7